MPSKIVQVLFFLSTTLAIGQEISGIVYDSKTKEPILGASVYFDGSSLGTITDLDGKFIITAPIKTHASLIISHLGYVLKRITNPLEIEGELRIAMVEEFQKIPEVVLTSDPFSRKQKLRVFRKEFLGDTRASDFCKILNEDSIELFFNTYDNTLSAYSKGPIVIENKYLGYLIKFDLDEFQIHFKRKSLDRIDNIKYTLFSGFTLFIDISNYDNKIAKRREKAYLGSPMHFMRTCWSNNWKGQNFTLKRELRTVSPDQILHIIDGDSMEFRRIVFQSEKFVVYFKNRGNHRSTVNLTEENFTFSIDKYGNYEPYKNLIFGGYMADFRIGDLLPIDFAL